MAEHWMIGAVGNGQPSTKYLGEDERGELCVPSRTRPGWWDRRFNPRNPTHWPYWLRSRLAKNIVWLEAVSGD